MSDGTFTESDAENDGLVKREAGQQLNSVLARESGELYTKFREYCDELGLDPSIVLGDMVLRAIRNEEFAQEVAGTVVNVEKLNRGKVKREDLEMVTDIIEQFSGNSDGGQDPIDDMLEERLSAVGQGPLGAVNDQRQQNGSAKDQRIRELEQQIQELKRDQGGGTNDTRTRTREQSTPEPSEPGSDIDSLFDDGGSEGGPEPEPEQAEGEEPEVVDLGATEAEGGAGTREDGMTAEPDDPFNTDNATQEEVENE